MSDTPSELRYTKTHEWARLDDDTVVVGISDYAQDALGDVVFVELPVVGDDVKEREEVAVVESVKAASDIYSPVSGSIIQVNELLDEQPELLNSDPYGEGWIFTISPTDSDDYGELLDSTGYEEFCSSEENEH